MKKVRQAVLSLLALVAPGFPLAADTPARPHADAGSAATPVPQPAPAISKGASARSTITVRIDGLRNDRGIVFVALYDSKRAFDEQKGEVAGAQARPANRSAVVVLENVVPGRYALSFIHDENENKKLDTNFIGIPKEGFGYSKDAMGRFGPPKFDDAAVVVPAGPVTVVMRSKYM